MPALGRFASVLASTASVLMPDPAATFVFYGSDGAADRAAPSNDLHVFCQRSPVGSLTHLEGPYLLAMCLTNVDAARRVLAYLVSFGTRLPRPSRRPRATSFRCPFLHYPCFRPLFCQMASQKLRTLMISKESAYRARRDLAGFACFQYTFRENALFRQVDSRVTVARSAAVSL